MPATNLCPHCSEAYAPDWEFHRVWSQAVLEDALKRIGVECARRGHAALWAELKPVLLAAEDTSAYARSAARLGMTSGAITIAARRMRARLNELMREAILQLTEV